MTEETIPEDNGSESETWDEPTTDIVEPETTDDAAGDARDN